MCERKEKGPQDAVLSDDAFLECVAPAVLRCVCVRERESGKRDGTGFTRRGLIWSGQGQLLEVIECVCVCVCRCLDRLVWLVAMWDRLVWLVAIFGVSSGAMVAAKRGAG